MATIVDVLHKVHVRYEKNEEYPDSTSEDHVVRNAYADDAITMWESAARNGTFWKQLITQASIPAAGSGSDDNETDFLVFMVSKNPVGNTLMPAIITDLAGTKWLEVSAADGNYRYQNNVLGNVFWLEQGKIRTFPAITGTITFPYIRKATRYPLGTELTELEIEDAMFLQEFIIAMLYLDDANMNQYNAHMNAASDLLDKMEYQTIIQKPEGSGWGFGM